MAIDNQSPATLPFNDTDQIERLRALTKNDPTVKDHWVALRDALSTAGKPRSDIARVELDAAVHKHNISTPVHGTVHGQRTRATAAPAHHPPGS